MEAPGSGDEASLGRLAHLPGFHRYRRRHAAGWSDRDEPHHNQDEIASLSHGPAGQCWDNAPSESSFASLKGELIDLQPWPTQHMARRTIVEYVAWYNGTRPHSTLGYRGPAEFEEDYEINKVA